MIQTRLRGRDDFGYDLRPCRGEKLKRQGHLMPIYEFKCNKCEEFFELLVMGKSDEDELKCPKCGSQTFERVVSTMNFKMGASSGGNPADKPGIQKRKCSSGSCSTYNIGRQA